MPAIRLEHGLKRTALLVCVSSLCAALGLVSWRGYLVRAITDEGLGVRYDRLLAAVEQFPDDPGVLARYARAELDEGLDREAAATRAASAAGWAANLSPNDYRLRLLLAEAEESGGNLAGAEAALREACRLAPNHAAVRWLMGNLLIRLGRVDEAAGELRRAAQANAAYLPQALGVLWAAAGGDLGKLEAVTGEGAEAQLKLANFLLERGDTPHAVGIYRRVNPAARQASRQGRDFLQALVVGEEIVLARTLWLEEVGGPAELVWDGGFEMDAPANFSYFTWALRRSEHARPRVAGGVTRDGQGALMLELTGRDTVQLDGEVRQVIAVRPGAAYRLECYARPKVTGGLDGLHMAVTSQSHSGWSAMTPPVNLVTDEWQQLRVDFIAPPDARSLIITLRRAPKFSYEEPARGAVWFDDVSLRELASGSLPTGGRWERN
jgi:tetratricopeptide (TPR) repeat protein